MRTYFTDEYDVCCLPYRHKLAVTPDQLFSRHAAGVHRKVRMVAKEILPPTIYRNRINVIQRLGI